MWSSGAQPFSEQRTLLNSNSINITGIQFQLFVFELNVIIK